MEKVYILILTLLFTSIIGIIGYWLKTAHNDFKILLKELVVSLQQLQQLVTGIETQIEKGIEADITELKTDIKSLWKTSSQNEKDIASLKAKSNK